MKFSGSNDGHGIPVGSAPLLDGLTVPPGALLTFQRRNYSGGNGKNDQQQAAGGVSLNVQQAYVDSDAVKNGHYWYVLNASVAGDSNAGNLNVVLFLVPESERPVVPGIIPALPALPVFQWTSLMDYPLAGTVLPRFGPRQVGNPFIVPPGFFLRASSMENNGAGNGSIALLSVVFAELELPETSE
jgi:hypothetical protein